MTEYEQLRQETRALRRVHHLVIGMSQANLHATVVSAACCARIRLKWRFGSYPSRGKPRFGDVKFADQRISYCDSATAGEAQVMGLPTKAVCVPFESNNSPRIFRELFGKLLQPRAILRVNHVAVFIEENAP